MSLVRESLVTLAPGEVSIAITIPNLPDESSALDFLPDMARRSLVRNYTGLGMSIVEIKQALAPLTSSFERASTDIRESVTAPLAGLAERSLREAYRAKHGHAVTGPLSSPKEVKPEIPTPPKKGILFSRRRGANTVNFK